MKKFTKHFLLLALLAIAAVTTVPARAQHQRYTAAVTLSDLQVGDTLAEGALVTDCSNYVLVVNRYCESQNGTDYQLNLETLTVPYQFDGPVGVNGLLSVGNGIISFLPVHEDGLFDNGLWQTGDVWVVANIDGTTLSLAGATRAYTATLADGGIDSDNWVISPAKAATTGVAAGTTVTLTYNGTRQVKSVTAVESTPSMLATPLTLEALTDGNITVNNSKSGMQYSKNGGEKVSMTSTTTIDVVAGDKVAFYGNGTSIVRYGGNTAPNSTWITGGTAQVKAYGNIMSLVDEENFATATTLPSTRTFAYLFANNTKVIDASSLVLPATTMTDSCYFYMFGSCSNMTAAPEVLPAMTLDTACYWNMFRSCSNLTTAPLLPATTLVEKCYSEMFRYCSKLSSVTCLATNIEESNKFLTNWLGSAGTNSSVTTRTLYVDPSLVSSSYWEKANFTVTAIQQ